MVLMSLDCPFVASKTANLLILAGDEAPPPTRSFVRTFRLRIQSLMITVPPPVLLLSISAIFAGIELIYLQLLEDANDVLANKLICI